MRLCSIQSRFRGGKARSLIRSNQRQLAQKWIVHMKTAGFCETLHVDLVKKKGEGRRGRRRRRRSRRVALFSRSCTETSGWRHCHLHYPSWGRKPLGGIIRPMPKVATASRAQSQVVQRRQRRKVSSKRTLQTKRLEPSQMIPIPFPDLENQSKQDVLRPVESSRRFQQRKFHRQTPLSPPIAQRTRRHFHHSHRLTSDPPRLE